MNGFRARVIGAVAVLLVTAACTDGPTAPAPTAEVGLGGPSQSEVWMPPGDNECDPWQDLNWCEDPGEPGDCLEGSVDPGEVDGVEGCGTGGGPGLGGGGDPPPADTCNTGDPVLDDATVRQGLKEMWEDSNPDANLAQRRETAGWIVQDSQGGLRVERWTQGVSNFACGNFQVNVPSSGTVVAFAHTHPYWVDEDVINCEWLIDTYTGDASDADRRASVQLGSVLGRSTPLPGYVLDKDGTYYFEGEQYTATPRGPRCGY